MIMEGKLIFTFLYLVSWVAPLAVGHIFFFFLIFNLAHNKLLYACKLQIALSKKDFRKTNW